MTHGIASSTTEPLPRNPAEDEGWTLITAANEEEVLHHTLLASPALDAHCRVVIERGARCAGTAYNRGLDRATTELVVFAHQDVYLPADWIPALRAAVRRLSSRQPQWGVLGVFGMTEPPAPQPFGYCYSTGLRRMLGEPFPAPVLASSLDEMVLILRRSSGLRFDERLPGFHLYGTDLCLQARARGLSAWIVPAFCIHNARGIVHLPAAFWRAYFHLRHKWRSRLPVATCCTTITRLGGPILHRLATEMRDSFRPRTAGARSNDVAGLYATLRLRYPEVAEQRRPLWSEEVSC